MGRVLGLVLILGGLLTQGAANESLDVALGQVKLRAFVSQVRDVSVQSASNAIATAWHSEGRGVFIRGENAGTTDVTIRATRIGAGGQPEAQPTVERIRVTISSQVREADDGRRGDGPTIVVQVGKTRTARFSRQTIGVRRHVSQPQVVSASFDNDALSLRGLRPGWSTLTISGEFVRYQAGINVPLQNNVPFSFQYNIHVVPEAEVLRVAEAIEVEAGKEWSMPLSQHAGGVSVSSADAATASAGYSNRVLTIRGRKVGETTVAAKGKLATWPDGGARRVDQAFEFTYRVTVKPPAYPGAEDVHREVKKELEGIREVLRGLTDQLTSFRDSLGKPEGASGNWKSPSGAGVRVVQQGARVGLINASGVVFEGSATGNRLRLVKRYVAASELPASLPAQVREKLVGSELVLEGGLDAAGTSMQATLISEDVKYNEQTFEITSRTPRRGNVVFTKQPDPPVPIPSMAQALAELQRDLARLDSEYEEYKKGARAGSEFVDHALLEVYAGAVERLFRARLEGAGAQVKMLAWRHGLAIRDLKTLFDVDSGSWAALSPEERASAKAALEAQYRPREKAIYDAIQGEYREATEALVKAQRALARGLFRWENFSRAREWSDRAQGLYKRAFELLCYRLGQQPEFSGQSTLDGFVAGADRLDLPPWLSQNVKNPSDMDEAFGELGLSRMHRESVNSNELPGEPADPEERAGLLTVTAADTQAGNALERLDLLVEDPSAPGTPPNSPNAPSGPSNPSNPSNPGAGVQTRSFPGAKPGEPPEPES